MSRRTEKLSKPAVQKGLHNLEGWNVNAKGTEILKIFLFKDFKAALRFVNRVGRLAEEVNHHPDILLSYGKVRIKLSTHSVGGLTEKDFSFARQIG